MAVNSMTKGLSPPYAGITFSLCCYMNKCRLLCSNHLKRYVYSISKRNLQPVLIENACKKSNIFINVLYRTINITMLSEVHKRCWCLMRKWRDILVFDIGLKAKPSSCAAMSAILYNKIPDVVKKKKR